MECRGSSSGRGRCQSESVDVERRDDAMAKPRHPASEEAPRVAHRSADPEISAPGLRERGAELHVRHRGEHGHDEVQAERQDERGTRDREAGPDEQKDRRPDRRAEPDHRDFQEPEVPAKFDLDLAALCHRVAAEWESLISPWWVRRWLSNT